MLTKLYEDYFPKFQEELQKIKSREFQPTNPLLLNININDINSKIPIMIFGQETNGWERTPKKSMEYLMKLYADFYDILLQEYPDRLFLQYHYEIKEMLTKNKTDDFVFIWNNICKVGKRNGKGWHGDKIEAIELEHFNIIPDEIKIVKPKYIILFTGPNYENEVFVRLKQLNVISDKNSKFGYMKHIQYDNIPGLMTYHPNYINRNGKKNYLKYIVSDMNKYLYL